MNIVQLQKETLAAIRDEVKQLHPLLELLLPKLPGVLDVEYTHGPTEMGADFVLSKSEKSLGGTKYVGVIAKVGKITQDYTDIERQITECEIERFFNNGKVKIHLSEIWIVTTGVVTEGAQKKIHDKYKYRNITFIDAGRLRNLINQHASDYWHDISLPADAKSYFQYFMGIVNENAICESINIFARLTNLEVRSALKEFAFPHLFPKLEEAVQEGKARMHYLVFLQSIESLDDPDTRKIVDAYTRFSAKVTLLFEDEAGSMEDTTETFVLLTEHQWVLTHGWDYNGRISMPFHKTHVKDFHQYCERFKRLEHESHAYHPDMAQRLRGDSGLD